MKRFRIFLFLIGAACVFLLSACAIESEDPAVFLKGQSAATIYHSAKKSLLKGDDNRAVKTYEALEVFYPFNRYSAQAQLDLMYGYYRSGNFPLAKVTAERFIHLYPNNQFIDYAYYIRALADMKQDRGWYLRYVPIDIDRRDPGTMWLAFDEFSQLIKFYPGSPYAADARQRMIYLRNLFARYELHIAEYYFKKKAFVATINRAREIVQRYQGAPEVQEALTLMIKSYHALKLEDLAQQSLLILKLNFSNHPQK